MTCCCVECLWNFLFKSVFSWLLTSSASASDKVICPVLHRMFIKITTFCSLTHCLFCNIMTSILSVGLLGNVYCILLDVALARDGFLLINTHVKKKINGFSKVSSFLLQAWWNHTLPFCPSLRQPANHLLWGCPHNQVSILVPGSKLDQHDPAGNFFLPGGKFNKTSCAIILVCREEGGSSGMSAKCSPI